MQLKSILFPGIVCFLLLSCSKASTSGQTYLAEQTDSSAKGLEPISIDTSNPKQNIESYLKIISDLSSDITYRFHTGRILAVPKPGRMAEPFADFVAIKQDRVRKLNNGIYQHGYRGVIFFTDLETGEILKTFENPLTGNINTVEQYATSKGSLIYTPEAEVYFLRVGGKPVKADNKFKLDWSILGRDTWVTYDERFEIRDAEGNFVSSDNSMYRYRTDIQKLADQSVNSVAMTMAWSTETGFWKWMDMKDYKGPGHLIFGSMGSKYNSLDDLPAKFVTAAEKYFPGHISTPVDWTEYDLDQPFD